MKESMLRTIQAGIAARLRVKDSSIHLHYAESTFVGATKGIIDESESLRVKWMDGKRFIAYAMLNQPSACFPDPVNVTLICDLMAGELKPHRA
jgi:hypothetical protein